MKTTSIVAAFFAAALASSTSALAAGSLFFAPVKYTINPAVSAGSYVVLQRGVITTDVGIKSGAIDITVYGQTLDALERLVLWDEKNQSVVAQSDYLYEDAREVLNDDDWSEYTVRMILNDKFTRGREYVLRGLVGWSEKVGTFGAYVSNYSFSSPTANVVRKGGFGGNSSFELNGNSYAGGVWVYPSDDVSGVVALNKIASIGALLVEGTPGTKASRMVFEIDLGGGTRLAAVKEITYLQLWGVDKWIANGVIVGTDLTGKRLKVAFEPKVKLPVGGWHTFIIRAIDKNALKGGELMVTAKLAEWKTENANGVSLFPNGGWNSEIMLPSLDLGIKQPVLVDPYPTTTTTTTTTTEPRG